MRAAERSDLKWFKSNKLYYCVNKTVKIKITDEITSCDYINFTQGEIIAVHMIMDVKGYSLFF